MITEAFQHCHGLGPVRLRQLHESGVRSWHDAINHPDRLPNALRHTIVDECRQSLLALRNDDIGWFVNRLGPQDRWRILSHYQHRTTFFDIETTGLAYDSTITMIACWHRQRLHTFVEHENLDDFLDLLDDVELLASFNGSTFDVPRVLDGFHIPGLPCPHLDLRWPCHHNGLRGGLKQISARLGIQRPADLLDADGELAVQLWSLWREQNDAAARDHLIRYCAADVLLLVLLSQHLARREDVPTETVWAHLPAAPAITDPAATTGRRDRFLKNMFGDAGPTKLRTRRSVVR